jgi:VCBS repeat-containing protein
LAPVNALTSLTINGGSAITAAQLVASGTTSIVVTTANGTLTINGYNTSTGAVNYSYTLTSPANHSAGNVNDSFSIVITNVDGNQANATLAINILDDAPVANADVDEVINISLNPSSTASGNVITGVGGSDPNNADGIADKLGADGAATSSPTPVTGVVAGTAGSPLAGNVGSPVSSETVDGSGRPLGILTLNADGSYVYTPNYTNTDVAALAPGATLTDTFTYSIADSDGDSATTTLTITIVGVPNVIGLNDGAVTGTDGSVLESNLAGGTNAAGLGEVLNGSFQLVSPAFGVKSLTIAGNTLSEATLIALTPRVQSHTNTHSSHRQIQLRR